MHKSELVDEVSKRADITKTAAAVAVDAAIDAITDSLKSGDSVVLTGFGTFAVVDRPARTARNPRTGEPIDIAAKKAVRFKPGKGLSEAL